MINVAVSDVELTTFTAEPVTPVPLIDNVVCPATNSSPVIVTGTVAPCIPDGGLILKTPGTGGFTVKSTVLLVPAAVVTVTVRIPSPASRAIANVAVRDVE